MAELFFYLLILFGIAALMRIDFFFSILYLIVGAVVLSRMWTRRTLENVRIERQYQDRAFLGEVIPVSLVVNNGTWLPINWLHLHESLPLNLISPNFHRQVVSLSPKATEILSYTLQCRRRGFYKLGPLAMSTSDLFGFEENTATWGHDGTMIVYPEIVPVQKLGLPSVSPYVSVPSGPRLFEDTSRVSGVRDYTSGDSPRHINWKTSAAAGKLLVKKYEPAISLDTTIFLDLYEPNYEMRIRYTASELGIVAAASIANHLTERQQAVGFVSNGLDPLAEDQAMPRPLATQEGQTQLMRILDILARVELGDTISLPNLISQQRPQLSWGATMLIITCQESDELLKAIVSARHAGFPVVLILTDTTLPSGPIEQQADTLGVRTYRLRTSEGLKTIFEAKVQM